MPIQIINIKDDAKHLYESSDKYRGVVSKVKELITSNTEFKAFEVSIDLKTFLVNEDFKEELNIIIDDDIDILDTIKRVTLFNSTNNESKKLSIFMNSKKRVIPENLIKMHKSKLESLGINKVDYISCSWSKTFKDNKSKTIYEENYSCYKFVDIQWVKSDSKNRRTF